MKLYHADWCAAADIEHWSQRLCELEYEEESEHSSDSEVENDGESDPASSRAAISTVWSLRQRPGKPVSYAENGHVNATKPVYGHCRRVRSLIEHRQENFRTISQVRLMVCMARLLVC